MLKSMKEWKKRISDKTGFKQTEVDAFYKAFQEVLIEEMSENDSTEVALPGIGKFKVNTQRNYTAINPRTKQAVVVPITKKITFKSYQSFKEKLK